MALASHMTTFAKAVADLSQLESDLIEGRQLNFSQFQALRPIIELIQSDRCLMKLKPGEPFFVYRGQDSLAPGAIKYWLSMIENTGTRLSEERIREISDIVRAMESYPDRKVPD